MILTRLLKTRAAVLVAAVGITTAGCMQSEEKYAIAKDGSGTAEANVTIELTKMEQLGEMVKGMFGGGEAVPEGDKPEKPKEPAIVEEWSEEKIKETLKEHPGIELVKYTNEKKDGKQLIHMELKFKDVADFAKAGFFGSKSVELVKKEDGSHVLTFDPSAGQGDKMGGGGAGPAAGMAEPDPMGGGDPSMFMGMLEPLIGTFEMKTKLTLPGTITETNGAKDGESTVSWAFGWKTIVDGANDKKAAELWTVTFKGEGVDLKPFKFKPDAEAMAKKMGLGPK